MAVNKLYKFRRIDDVVPFLNGAVVGGSVNRAQGGGTPANLGAGINGLVGKTLKFTKPAVVTVTFVVSSSAGGSADPPGTNPDPYTLLFKDIKKQVEAAIATVKVLLDSEQKIVFVEATPSGGVTLDKTGTANTLLGFDNNEDVVGKVYTPASVVNVPPCWTWAYSGNDNMHNVYTWE
jgi:hypothetical protein